MEKYDLFVSYADADRAWVEGYLLNALKQAGVHYLSEEAFALGAVRLQEFERAIQQSHRTLLVLSYAYLADNLSQFIDLLAQCFGLDNQTWPVIPLLLGTLKLPPHLAVLVQLDATQEEKWESAIARLCRDLKHDVPTSIEKPDCPYPGMIPFSEASRDYFFGREQEVQDALGCLRLHPFLTIIGPSGSGKSSFVFAGLVPALRQSRLLRVSEWRIRIMRPGETPLTTLKRTLVSGDILNSALTTNAQPTHQTLLVVDQFEELFTISGTERELFEKALLRFMQFPHCYLVLTVRADFYPDLMVSSLWRQIQGHRLEIVPLNEFGLRRSIIRPAEAVEVFIEPALVERLVVDAVGEPGILPLLQETLVLLWERIERRFLPLRAYEALVLPRKAYGNGAGEQRTGLQVAIARRANISLADLDEEQQAIARRIFLRLIQFGEGRADTRRQQSVTALKATGDNIQKFNRTLHHLANCRLLTLTGAASKADRKVDIAHEALIVGWPTLQEWIAERRDAEQLRRRLIAKVEEWVRLSKEGGLLDEVELAEAQRWLESPDAKDLGYDENLTELVQASQTAIQETKQLEEEAQRRELNLIRESLEQERKAKEQERKARKAAQTRNIIASILTISTIFLSGLFYRQLQYSKVEEIKSLNATSEAQLISNYQLEAIETSLRAGKIFQQWNWLGVNPTITSNVRMQTVATLQQAVEGTQEINRLEGHSLQVNSVSVSPDGQLIASGSDDLTVRIWNSDGTLRYKSLENHRITSVAFSPNGKTLAFTGADGSVKLWSPEETELKKLVVQGEWITNVTWSHNGFLAASSRDGTVKLWNPDRTSRRSIQVPQGGVNGVNGVNAISFSPNGQILATGEDNFSVQVWNVANGKPAASPLKGHTDAVKSIAFNPADDKVLASAGLDGKIILWDLSTRKSQVLEKHTDWVNSIQFSSDGKLLVSTSHDGTLKLWRVSDGELLETIHNTSRAAFLSAVFNPVEQTVISGSATGRISVWSSVTTNLLTDCGATPALAVSFSPDDQTLAFVDNKGTVQLRDRDCKSLKLPLKPSQKQQEFYSSNSLTSSTLSFSTDGQILAAGYDNNTIDLWNPTNGTLLKSLTEHQGKINGLSFSPTTHLLASASDDKTIRIWDFGDFSTKQILREHQDSVSSIVFSPNEKLLGSGSYDGTVMLWQLSNQEFQFWKSLQAHPEGVTALAFSPDNQTLVSAGANGVIKVWKIGDDTPQRILIGHQQSVISLVFSDDGGTLISGSSDNIIKFWNYKDGTLIKTLLDNKALSGDSANSVLGMGLSPDQKLLISANEKDGLLLRTFDLDNLLKRGCDRIQTYLRADSERNINRHSSKELCS
jgi:WD40 repeat protein